MKKIILVLFLFLAVKLQALTGEVCFTGQPGSSIQKNMATMDFEVTALRCQTLQNIHAGLDVLQIGIRAVTVSALCGGISAPAAVYIGVAGAVTDMLDLSLNLLPCEKEETALQIKSDTRTLICEKLASGGLYCNENTTIEIQSGE